MTLGNDNGTDATDRWTDRQTECDAICGPPPREEGRIINTTPKASSVNSITHASKET